MPAFMSCKTDRPLDVDACVVGGGPAGSASALRLAKLGYRVLLVEAQDFPRPHVGECLSSGVWPVLDLLDLRKAISAEHYLSIPETWVLWADGHPELVRQRGRAEAVSINRSSFDFRLLSAARSAGVIVVQPARARGQGRTGRMECIGRRS